MDQNCVSLALAKFRDYLIFYYSDFISIFQMNWQVAGNSHFVWRSFHFLDVKASEQSSISQSWIRTDDDDGTYFTLKNKQSGLFLTAHIDDSTGTKSTIIMSEFFCSF